MMFNGTYNVASHISPDPRDERIRARVLYSVEIEMLRKRPI